MSNQSPQPNQITPGQALKWSVEGKGTFIAEGYGFFYRVFELLDNECTYLDVWDFPHREVLKSSHLNTDLAKQAAESHHQASIAAEHSRAESWKTEALALRDLVSGVDKLVELLYEVLPYVESEVINEAYKPGVISKMVSKIRVALAEFEKGK